MGETSASEARGGRVADASREPPLDPSRPRALGHDDEAWREGGAGDPARPLVKAKSL